MGLRGRPNAAAGWRPQMGWFGSPSLSLLTISKKPKLGRNAERDTSGVWAGSKFFQTHKNELDPRKMEMNTWVKFETNSFECNSNGFA